MGRTVGGCERFIADVDRAVVARQAPGCGELAGVGVREVGVSATGGPAELDDLLGALEHLDGAPVLHAAPQRRVADALVDAAGDGLRSSATTLGMLARFGALPDEPAHLSALIDRIDRPDDLVGGPWSQAAHILAAALDQLLTEVGSDGDIELLPTHRDLATVIGALLAPTPADSIHDPAAGSGRLLLAAHAAAVRSTRNRSELARLRDDVFAAGERYGRTLHGGQPSTCCFTASAPSAQGRS